ncbi:MAG: hypothetical protein Q4A29_02520 [Eubacteriales bacterium]|nr:hypothetical protein [Eubacteriales bacterium]
MSSFGIFKWGENRSLKHCKKEIEIPDTGTIAYGKWLKTMDWPKK